MSVAFTREESAETAAEVQLPDCPISPHPNLVTASGLKALDIALAEARAAYDAAHLVDDMNERRRAAAPAIRDLKYLTERLQSAQLIEPASAGGAVAFGVRVSVKRNDGPLQTYRIVGEDEADPKRGSISYISPLARALNGKAVGDIVGLSDDEIEIVAISD